MTENYDFNEIEKFAQEFKEVQEKISTELSLKRDELIKGWEDIERKVFSEDKVTVGFSFELLQDLYELYEEDKKPYITIEEEDPEELKRMFRKEKKESPTWKGQQTEEFKKWIKKREEEVPKRKERHEYRQKASEEYYRYLKKLYRKCLEDIKIYEKNIEDFKGFFKNSVNKMIGMMEKAPKCPCVSVRLFGSNDNTPRIAYVRKKRKFLLF